MIGPWTRETWRVVAGPSQQGAKAPGDYASLVLRVLQSLPKARSYPGSDAARAAGIVSKVWTVRELLERAAGMTNSNKQLVGCGFIVLSIFGFCLAGGVFAAQTEPPIIVEWIATIFFFGGWELSAIIGFVILWKSWRDEK